ncbi:MAG: DUF1275 domain-containing protein [Peptococcaceae bacterium]|nr:DUF1275 domain-containing protein [Peptococcaceae bacterium]
MGTANNDAAKFEWSVLQNPTALRVTAGALTFLAGIINGLASVALVFARVSHMSGRIIDQAQYLLIYPIHALFVSTLIFSFFAGTILGSIALQRFKLTGALLLATVPILAAALVVTLGIHGSSANSYEPARFLIAFLLPLGMGWQNSVTSQTRLGRTTHMTGELTDLGVCISKGYWERAGFLFIKYAAFFLGAIFGYVGAKFSPALTLLLSAAGIVMTTLCLQYWDSISVNSATKTQS